MYQINAFYKFCSLSQRDLLELKDGLPRIAADTKTRGLIVIGEEGYNATLAGIEPGFSLFMTHIRTCLDFEGVLIKESSATFQPFSRFKVDIRSEIITFTRPDQERPVITPPKRSNTHLTPRQWQELLDSQEDLLLIDTRNTYETELGTFKNALIPPLKKFSDFPEYLEEQQVPKEKKLLLFCTGGIRCEKAVPELERRGYNQVFQLEGGILNYLKEFPSSHYEGECFVFDKRVAVDQELQPSKKWKLCPHCGDPGSVSVNCRRCGKSSVLCHVCSSDINRGSSCSKDCREQLRRQLSRQLTAA
jgi:UPF0176 protein